MNIKEEVEEMKNQVHEIQEHSFASQILSDYKKDKKRLFIIILVILSFWFATIGAFVYYINTTGYEETTEYAETDKGGNACVGDNCNNGVINGESSKEN